MPSIHISEAVFREMVEQEGGYDEAKQRVKELAREDIEPMSVTEKVAEVVFNGSDVSIIDDSEKNQAKSLFQDYLDHGGKGETVERRAENAINQLER